MHRFQNQHPQYFTTVYSNYLVKYTGILWHIFQ